MYNVDDDVVMEDAQSTESSPGPTCMDDVDTDSLCSDLEDLISTRQLCDDTSSWPDLVVDLDTTSDAMTRCWILSSPPLNGELKHVVRVMTQVPRVRMMTMRFGQSASVAYRTLYMFAYIIENDGWAIRIAQTVLGREGTTKADVDGILVYLCMFIVMDQTANEIAHARFDFINNISVTSELEMERIVCRDWVALMADLGNPWAGWERQMHCMPFSSIVNLVHKMTGNAYADVFSFMTRQHRLLLQFFDYRVTGTFVHYSEDMGGFGNGQWDPVTDMTEFDEGRVWKSHRTWLDAQITLMHDLQNPKILAHFLQSPRSAVTSEFKQRHCFLFLKQSVPRLHGLLSLCSLVRERLLTTVRSMPKSGILFDSSRTLIN